MKKIFFTLAIALATLASSAQEKTFDNPNSDSRGYLVKVGDQAPDNFDLVLQNGTKTSLKELKGKIVILQFTASWCTVCREEMPYLESDIWQAYKDKDVVLIGVDRDEPLATVQKFHKDIKISYPLALDPGAEIFQKFADKKAGVTRNVVIDRQGKIRFLTRLYDKEEFSKLVQAVDGLSKEQIASR
ncbi:Peroxiredoxin [Pedobacter westerhofensis]|uniref:Peroxiredoxin n=1 Tax=Pedobacter westerhofensis TaxID=425512 RepID=A0A521FMD6_9SPHI|nr:TlpA disulfide reductase family protein [Pedobacter westerhofensis]SMO97284.1 Peroxiredoxin [Pedobacter westerhofensis]